MYRQGTGKILSRLTDKHWNVIMSLAGKGFSTYHISRSIVLTVPLRGNFGIVGEKTIHPSPATISRLLKTLR